MALPIVRWGRFGLGAPNHAPAFAQTSLDADYLSAAAGISMVSAMTWLAIIDCTAVGTNVGTIIQCQENTAMIGGVLRINLATSGLLFGAYDALGVFKGTTYVRTIVGEGKLFVWGTFTGTTIRSGVGRPSDITPATNTFTGGGVKTGAVGDSLDFFDWNESADRDFAGTIDAMILGELLSDAELDAIGSAMSLASVRTGKTIVAAPRPKVAIGAAIESGADIEDAAGLTWSVVTQGVSNSVVGATL